MTQKNGKSAWQNRIWKLGPPERIFFGRTGLDFGRNKLLAPPKIWPRNAYADSWVLGLFMNDIIHMFTHLRSALLSEVRPCWVPRLQRRTNRRMRKGGWLGEGCVGRLEVGPSGDTGHTHHRHHVPALDNPDTYEKEIRRKNRKFVYLKITDNIYTRWVPSIH